MYIQHPKLSPSDKAHIFKYRAFSKFDEFLNYQSKQAILKMNGTYETHQLAIKAIQLQISYLDREMKKDMKHAPKSLGHQSMLKTIKSRIEQLETIPALHS